MKAISFVKMHGTGNDFIIIDGLRQKTALGTEQVKKMCRRRLGIGADQVILVGPSRKADFKMRIFNADGGEVEMCGNGIRCVAKYLFDGKLTSKKTLEIETLAGIVKPEVLKDGRVKVDMGTPILEGNKIPVKLSGRVINRTIKAGDREFRITCVSMGNPHCVIFIDKVGKFAVSQYGPILEHHPLFPRRTNVEFIERISIKEIRMRTWERGTGETAACGSGACAAVVAGVLNSKIERKTLVHLLGGELGVEWAKDEHVYLTGQAEEVFRGEVRT